MRKLAIASGAFSASIFLAEYLLPGKMLLPLALALALLGILLILPRRQWLLPLVIGLCASAAGLYLYQMHGMLTVDRAHELDGSVLEGRAYVLTAPEEGDGYWRAEIRMQTDDKHVLRTMLYDRGGSLSGAEPGDIAEGSFALHSADTRFGEPYSGNIAKGIYLTANNRGELTIVHTGRLTLRAVFEKLNHRLCERIDLVFPGDTSAFFKSLMLGEKSEFYEDDALSLAMSRAGLMHIVAVSGMHIAFLAGMLRQLLGRTRRSAILSLLLTWCFVLVTGAGPSALRAGIMQTVVLLAPILGREDDPPTSLLFALALILLVNPFAAASVSLQLSFSAFAGILLFSDRISCPLRAGIFKPLPRRLRNHLSANIANSLSVLVFSVPLVGLYFGYVSVLAPLSNLLTLWAVPFCFGGGYLSCALSIFSRPLGRAAAWLVSWLARYIIAAAKAISSIGFSCVYLCLNVNIGWLILVYVLLLAGLLIRTDAWKRWFFPAGIAVFSLFVMLTATRMYYASPTGYMTAVDVGQGQSLVVFSGDTTVVIDCGSINSLEDAGDQTGAYLLSRGRERIDLLILTHLHADHADGVTRLMEYLPVERILIGKDMEDPNDLLPAIRRSAQAHGTEIVVIEEDREIREGDLCLSIFAPGQAGDINERCLTVKAGIDGYDMLVTGDINAAAERELLREHSLRDIELLIVGHHGSKYACCRELLTSVGADEAIISCGYNSFGHPTEETLERLRDCGYTVSRTDEDGTVEIRLP